jgi:hypothetical protein
VLRYWNAPINAPPFSFTCRMMSPLGATNSSGSPATVFGACGVNGSPPTGLPFVHVSSAVHVAPSLVLKRTCARTPTPAWFSATP